MEALKRNYVFFAYRKTFHSHLFIIFHCCYKNVQMLVEHRWTRGVVEGGHPPLVAEISTPPGAEIHPPSGMDSTPPPFFVPGQIFLNGNV